MKNITKKLFYIIVIGAINFGICYIAWIPNKFLEILLWVMFIGLTLWSIYLIYRIIKEAVISLGKSYSTEFIRLGLFLLFGISNFINFLVISFSGSYENEYEFENKSFYVYDSSFRDSMCEISVKVDYLPIRKEIVTVDGSPKDNTLYKEANMVYFLWNEKKHDLYDLNRSSIVIVWG
jgi:hypothetical protein